MSFAKFMKYLRWFLVGCVFCASGAMTMLYTASFGSGVGNMIVMGGVGVTFEVIKALVWLEARSGRWWKTALGVMLSLFSLFASYSYATVFIERGMEIDEQKVNQNQKTESATTTLQKVEAALSKDLDHLSTDREGIKLRIALQLQSLENDLEKQQTKVQTQSVENSEASSILVFAFARRYGWDGGILMSIMLGVMATLIEVCIAVLTLNEKPKLLVLPTKADDFDELARFMREAKNMDGKVFSRREMVKRGWAERDVRRIVRTLELIGTLKNEGQGKGLSAERKKKWE